MLAKAAEFPDDPKIEYRQADLNTLKVEEGEFDAAFSSLALHYLPDLGGFVKEVFKGLKEKGVFVFSVEHPTWTAPRNPDWIEDKEGKLVWPLDRYCSEGERITNWMADGVAKYHRMISTYVMTLLEVGFKLERICEWSPSDEQLIEYPDVSIVCFLPHVLLNCTKEVFHSELEANSSITSGVKVEIGRRFF